MSPRVRQLVGLVTVGLFAVVGVSLILEERLAAGTIVLGLAGFRLVIWVRQQLALMSDAD